MERWRLLDRLPRRPALRGLTLVELAVVIAVLALLVAFGVPSLTDALTSRKLTMYANGLVSAAHLARSEAIKRNQPATLCASASGDACDSTNWADGWVVMAGGAVLQRFERLADGYVAEENTGNQDNLHFSPTGVDTTPGTFTICRKTPLGKEERTVTISITGATHVEKTRGGVCP